MASGLGKFVALNNLARESGQMSGVLVGVITPHPERIAREMGIDRKTAVFQPLGADALHHPTHRFSHPHRQFQGFVVGINALLNSGPSIATTGDRGRVEISLNQLEQVRPTGVAHHQPLTSEFTSTLPTTTVGATVPVVVSGVSLPAAAAKYSSLPV